MPGYNGSGTYERHYDFTDDAANGINIEASRMDAELDEIANALSSVVVADGQKALTGNLDFGTNKAANLGTPSAATDAATKGYVDTPTAARSMNSQRLTDLPAPTADNDAARKKYVDDAIAAEAASRAAGDIYKKIFNATLAPGAQEVISNADTFANTLFFATCWAGGSNANDGYGSFSAGYNGASNVIAATGIGNVSDSHNWASPPSNGLIIGRDSGANAYNFRNTTAFTLNVTIFRTG